MLKCDIITGRELKRSVRDKNVGNSPPRAGRQTRISDEQFKLICSLVFTTLTIEQANGDPNRLSRPALRSAIMEVVNEKLNSDGEDELNDVKFWERIQMELAKECSITAIDPREALRWAWGTHKNQLDNYVRWEEALVELGFGHYTTTDEERRKHGRVKIDPEQLYNIVQIDEMGFSLDGSKNGKGGRKAAMMENTNAPNPRTPTNHSSAKISGLFAINMAKEALPPLFVLPSDAESKFINF